MRITDPQVIRNGEKDLISSVQKDLDLDAVRDLLKERLGATALSPKGGQIIVHKNDVAFRLDYEINLNASLLFDRNGNLLEDNESTEPQQAPQRDQDAAAIPTLDDNLSINVPDYDETLDEDTWKDPAQVLEPDDEPDDFKAAAPGLDLEDDFAVDQDASNVFETDDGDDPIDDLTQTDDLTDLSAGELTDIEDLDDDFSMSQDGSNIFEADDGDDPIDDLAKADDLTDLSTGELTEIDLEDRGKKTVQDIDNDIDDILQESRDFWENKKD